MHPLPNNELRTSICAGKAKSASCIMHYEIPIGRSGSLDWSYQNEIRQSGTVHTSKSISFSPPLPSRASHPSCATPSRVNQTKETRFETCFAARVRFPPLSILLGDLSNVSHSTPSISAGLETRNGSLSWPWTRAVRGDPRGWVAQLPR
jgi:hypothetical protein